MCTSAMIHPTGIVLSSHHLRHYCRRNFTTFARSLATYSIKTYNLEVLDTFTDHRVTEVIDVRSPAEFAIDHIPGAVNLPVLTNIERSDVGTLYNKDKFSARKYGAAQVMTNIVQHINEYFVLKDCDYSPMVYCFRGGQRSQSMAMILSQIGFKSYLLSGGHKHYRMLVRTELETLPHDLEFQVISGLTGTGKTKILHALQARGEQVLDLEGLAKHKGSVLGLHHGEMQPSQKYFESLVAQQLRTFVSQKTVWLESESGQIGKVHVPGVLFEKLCHAPRYQINLSMDQRVKHILTDYQNWAENRDDLKLIISRLVKVQGHKQINEWLTMIDENKGKEFVESLLTKHYDPAYTLSQTKNNQSISDIEQLHIPDLSTDTLEHLVSSLIVKPVLNSHQCDIENVASSDVAA